MKEEVKAKKKRPSTGRKQEVCSTPVEVVYRRASRAPRTISAPAPVVTAGPVVEVVDVSKYYDEPEPAPSNGCGVCGGAFCAGCFG